MFSRYLSLVSQNTKGHVDTNPMMHFYTGNFQPKFYLLSLSECAWELYNYALRDAFLTCPITAAAYLVSEKLLLLFDNTNVQFYYSFRDPGRRQLIALCYCPAHIRRNYTQELKNLQYCNSIAMDTNKHQGT